ncbi:MAG: hypothetical protein U0V72_07630 [Cytophagales bacterium]
MNFTEIYRHGDVLIYKLDQELNNVNDKVIKQLILAEGEVTGHAHRLTGDVEIIQNKPINGEMIFQVNDSAVLSHEEHDKIVLSQGVYLKVNQVEYNPFTDLVKKVMD